MHVQQADYGAWPSPISAQMVARSGVRLEAVAFAEDGALWWAERRPTEGGRTALVRRDPNGDVADGVPTGFDVRTRVHEYGGGAWLPVPGGVVAARWDDQRLYLLDGAAEPIALTPPPPQPQGDRYADLVLASGGDEVWCVRERAAGPGVERDLVAVPLDGSGAVRTIVVDGHFLSSPRLAPDGRHLAWLTWEHPRMPWDGTELRVAQIAGDGAIGVARTLLGGVAESVFQPEWAGPDRLYAVSDRSGWWNLHEVGLDGSVRALCPRAEEFGAPQWQFGMATHGLLDDGRIAVLHGTGVWSLGVLDPATGSLTDVSTPYTEWAPGLRVRGAVVAAVASSPAVPPTVVTVDTATGQVSEERRSVEALPDPRYLPEVRAETLTAADGRDVHVLVSPPRNPDVTVSSGRRPPYVAFVHGGPTGRAPAVLDLQKAFFTSRGIGVVDVNYGGSAGYGRAYRDRLRGQWGVVDVEDVAASVASLVERGDADGQRLAVRGGSAGGWTVLAALTRTDVFAAGTSYYGVADALALAEHTHDFESRYLDGLLGPLPQARSVYLERSALSHVDRLRCPVLLLQGEEDRVVPPAQAETFRTALRAAGIPHACLLFPGEQHGFRRAETVAAAVEAELSFYGHVFGFTPPGVAPLALEGGGPPGAEPPPAGGNGAARA